MRIIKFIREIANTGIGISHLLGALTLALVLVACVTDSDKVPGPTVEALGDAAVKQKDATTIIDKEASKIQKKSKEDASKASAGKIREANVQLKNNVDILEQEADAKETLEGMLVDANEEIAELKANDNAVIRYITYGLIGLGTVLMAVGAILFVKSGMTQWEVAALGLSFVTSAMLTNWLAANFIWFIVGLAGIALVGVILWVFLRTDKVSESAVKVAEMLKHEIKELEFVESEDTEDDEQYVLYADVQGILDKVFGNQMHAGQAGAMQSDGVVAHITAKRKKLIKKAKSFYE